MKRMVIAGGSGFVGSGLKQRAMAAGYDVVILGRTAAHGIERWDPVGAAHRDTSAVAHLAGLLDGADVVVNLAGASIGAGRLSKTHKAQVIGSRVDATRAVANALAMVKKAPRVWANASANGFYGDSGEEKCDEMHAPGNNFLAEVCTTWEREALQGVKALGEKAPRLVVLRIGVVLDKGSDAWQKMSAPIRLGVGGPMGSGKQWISWISLEDLGRATMQLIETPSAQGPFNMVSPAPIRQGDLVKQAAKAMGRPAFFPVPAFGLKLLLGDLAENVLLSSAYTVPKGLERLGYAFAQPTFADLLPLLI